MIFQHEVQFFTFDKFNYDELFNIIKQETKWDKTMNSRWTASYGMPYDYNDLKYAMKEPPIYIKIIMSFLQSYLGYTPNNCLINYYNTPNAKMGFHSDNIDILDNQTGITILSLGAPRIMKFKNKIDGTIKEILLQPNQYFHMSTNLQKYWKHAVLNSQNINSTLPYERISLTFRKIITT